MTGRLRGRAGRIALSTAGLVVAGVVVLTLALLAVMLVAGSPLEDGWAVAAVAVATVVGAVAWPVARRGVQASVDRVIHGGPRTPEDVLRSFQHGDKSDVPVDELLIQVAEALVRSMQVSVVEIWLHDVDGTLERRVSIPHREPALVDIDPAARRTLGNGGVVGRAWLEMWCPSLVGDEASTELRAVPAAHAGDLLGVVVLVHRGVDRFDQHDDAELGGLGGRLGLVLHNRRLDAALQDTLRDLRQTNAELRASRVRLVATADAERRRLERNLHDGAQQHLVALAVNLRLAADEIAGDPTAAPALFADLDGNVREAITELRTLAHGIYPPLLVDEGLVEALRVSARRSASLVAVSTDAEHPVGRYAPEVEAAVYFCCMEALQNAGKHAAGAPVEIAIVERDGILRVTVEDEGPGFEPSGLSIVSGSSSGHGLGNMADRIGAIGGTLALNAAPGHGVRIVVSVPVGGDR